MENCIKTTGTDGKDLIIFSSGWCPLNNMYPSPFRIYGVLYRSANQFYQALKAKQFNDLRAYSMIMDSWSGKTQSQIASTIKGFVQLTWDAKADEVMKRALTYKFKNNEQAKQFLLGTGTATIAFASLHQPHWGTGLKIDDPGNLDPTRYRGKNRLGGLLMEVRDSLRV